MPVVAIVAIILMVGLILGGVWISFAIGFAALVGLYPVLGDALFTRIGSVAFEQTTNFTLSAVPLFILMGEIIFRSGLATRLFDGLGRVFRRLPGGLLQANIAASAAFASTSGSSVATAATLAPIVSDEQIGKRNYDRRLVVGSVAAGGTLGILIPPSIVMLVYGGATGTSVGRLFAAGVVPGLMVALMFGVYIAIRALINPKLAPADPRDAQEKKGTTTRAVLSMWPFALLAVVVLGSIYGGIATPTEAAGVGCFLAILIALVTKRFTWKLLIEASLAAAKTSAMVFFIVIAANVMASLVSYYNMTQHITAFGNALDPVAVIVFLVVLYLILGCIFDSISMLVLTVPFAVPLILASGYGTVWFGIILVIVIEIGLLTPPVGMNLFVVQSATGIRLGTVIRGSLPFVGLLVLAVVIITAFPSIATWLPDLIYGAR